MRTNIFTQFISRLTIGLLFSSVLFGGTCSNLLAQYSIDWQWHDAFGSTGNDFGEKVIMDDDGNLYVTIQYSGTIDVDPSATTVNLVSNGNLDCAIVCYDTSGNYQWAKSIGGTGEDRIWEIEWKNNHLYFAGSFSNTVDFDPGAGTVNRTSSGNLDIYFAKFEDDGDYVWVNTMGESDRDEGWAIAIGTNDDVYIACGFRGTMDFNPGASNNNLTSLGNYDMVIGKYDNNGNHIWAKRIGNTGFDFLYSMDLDNDDNLFVGGFFEGTVDFDPDAGTQNRTSNGNWDFTVASYDSSGAYRWANTTGGTAEDRVYSVIVGSNGDVFASGWFSGSNIDFDPSAGTANLSSNGGNDLFFAKYENDGDLLWAKGIGGTGFDGAFCVYIDNSDEVYVTGQFTGTNVDFNPGAGTDNLTSSGTDIFLAKYDVNGDFIWARRPSGTGNEDNLRGLVVDENSHSIYSTGHFSSTVDFDVEGGTQNAISAGSYDFVLVKYIPSALDPLPVELSYFLSECNNSKRSFSWATLTEINNAYFTIEKSTDLIQWTEFSRITGAGNSNQVIEYSYQFDADIFTSNESYFRLIQTDFNGNFKLYSPIVSQCSVNTSVSISMYPNPTVDFINVLMNGAKIERIEVIDVNGSVIKVIDTFENSVSVDISDLAPGLYSVVIYSKQEVFINKLVKL